MPCFLCCSKAGRDYEASDQSCPRVRGASSLYLPSGTFPSGWRPRMQRSSGAFLMAGSLQVRLYGLSPFRHHSRRMAAFLSRNCLTSSGSLSIRVRSGVLQWQSRTPYVGGTPCTHSTSFQTRCYVPGWWASTVCGNSKSTKQRGEVRLA